ncbi:MAG: hypothetical protein JWL85_278 [Candidatus Saccharibacteria bacterium]|nr:hypothetical protein [Candidatus Saccharibacteria bacterium]
MYMQRTSDIVSEAFVRGEVPSGELVEWTQGTEYDASQLFEELVRIHEPRTVGL